MKNWITRKRAQRLAKRAQQDETSEVRRSVEVALGAAQKSTGKCHKMWTATLAPSGMDDYVECITAPQPLKMYTIGYDDASDGQWNHLFNHQYVEAATRTREYFVERYGERQAGAKMIEVYESSLDYPSKPPQHVLNAFIFGETE